MSSVSAKVARVRSARRGIVNFSAGVCAALCVLAVSGLTSVSTAERPNGPTARQAGCGTEQRFRAGKDLGPDLPPLAIGDSVLLGAAEEVAALGFDVNVRGCRMMSEALEVLQDVADAGPLPDVVAIAVGTNWTIERSQVRAALRILGPDRVLGLVTPRELGGGWGSDARILRSIAACRPKRTVLLDWVRYARRHRGMTYDDGVHLTAEGQKGMARVFRAALPARLAKREIGRARC